MGRDMERSGGVEGRGIEQSGGVWVDNVHDDTMI